MNEDAGVVITAKIWLEGVFFCDRGIAEEIRCEAVFDSLCRVRHCGDCARMAVSGLRPIVELQFEGFTYPAFNQNASSVSRMQNRSRRKYNVPMEIRFPYGVE